MDIQERSAGLGLLLDQTWGVEVTHQIVLRKVLSSIPRR
jgi:hypothetical protein